MISVLLVNESRLMSNVLTAALEDEPDIQIVGSATSVDEALEMVRKRPVDIVLASTRLPQNGALRLVENLTTSDSSTDILVLGVTEKKERVLQFVEAGASGYVAKDSSVEDLIETIRATSKGKALASPEITAALMERLSTYAQMFADLETGVVEDADLTPRELDVLKLLGKNMTNQEIADELVIEVGTVKNHVHSILSKLNVSARDEAATYLALIKRSDNR
ncbi:MAG: response regulator [Anaerolineales bacterium]|jgi:DNA-binding NarL/FixJ family response regulator